jgi:hypothetical protein
MDNTMANATNAEAEAGKYIGLGLAIAGTLAIGMFLVELMTIVQNVYELQVLVL